MFKQILYTHWKWAGWLVVGAAVAAFAIPVASVRGAGAVPDNGYEVSFMLQSMELWGYFYPVLAGAIGLILGITAWNADHAGRHVYALSLPIPRWHYALLRFGAGALLLLPVVAAMWIGTLVAVASLPLPTGLAAFPSTISLRFALATLMTYSLFFAVASGTKRTAGGILAVILGVVALQAVLAAVGSNVELIDPIFERLTRWPGPFEVLTARWMLINV
jgi:hypothetical protein